MSLNKQSKITKKIIFLRSIKTKFGGAEVFLSRLTEALKQRNIDFEILNSSAPKFLPSWIKVWWFNLQVKIKKLRNSNLFYFSLDRLTSADIYRAGDGVHKAFLKTRSFSLNPLHLSYLILEKSCFKNSKHIVANSSKTKQEILEHYPNISPSKISIISNGLLFSKIPFNSLDQPENTSKIKEKIAQEFKVNSNIPFILFIGSGFKRKGVSEFLNIISKIKTPFHAFIIGKEKKLFLYQDQAAELNLSQKITFTGQRSDTSDFYLASSLFIYPAQYEPFGNVILEAMAHGCVALTNKNTGALEILPPEFDLDHPESINLINLLLENPEKLKQAQELQITIAKQYPIEKTADQTFALILKIMGES